MTESFRPTVIRAQAWEALRGNWNMGAVACLVIYAVSGLSSLLPLASLLISLFVLSIVQFGTSFLFLDVFRGQEVKFETLFEGFQDYTRYLVGALLIALYTFLWLLLLIVPGIIKELSYSLTPFILRENPTLKGEEAIRRSMDMMEGHKMDLFLLRLSFIGWFFLGLLAFGIGLLWVTPYIYTAQGAFYEEVKKEYDARQAFA